MGFNNETERAATFFPDLTVGFKEKAGGVLTRHRLADIASDGDAEQSAANSTAVIGVVHSVHNNRASAVAGDYVSIGVGRQTVTADIAPITPPQALKAAGGGRVTPFVDAALSGDTIEDNVGAGFTNQPANDGVEMVSSDAGDTTQTATIYYTRNGQGDTVYIETKTINGTTQVAFTHTDIALVLAVEKSAATTGTITFREASANQTITTLAAGTLSAGKITVTAAQIYAYNVAPTATVDAASTKQLGLIGTDSAGTTIYDSQALTGTVPVTFNSAFRTVTFLLTGDLEVARTATVKIGAEDSIARFVGTALEASTAADTLIDAYLSPARLAAGDVALLDGVVAGTASAGKALVADSNLDLAGLRHLTLSGNLIPTANVGTAAAGTTAAEFGDSRNHVTVLTVSTTLPAIAGGANLAVGKLLYTMPAGACVIRSAKMSLAITQTQGNITADTPDGGLGSVIGSGVVATLDGTATFEDILTGQTFNDCNGTAEVKTVANQPMVMETGAAHTVHFNVADGWAASGDAAAVLAGTVILDWAFLG